MINPFEAINTRLSSLEALTQEALKCLRMVVPSPVTEVGGIELAQQITRLSKPRIYALVSARELPHYKRGGRLTFSRAELLDWMTAGKRDKN